MVKRIVGCGILLALAFTVSGCKRGIGDRCQVDSDCDSNVCAYIGTPNTAIGGTCEAQPLQPDGAPPPPVDAAPDAPPDGPLDASIG